MQKGAKQYIALLSLCIITIYLLLYVPRYMDYFKDTSKVVTVQGKIFFHSDRFGKKGQTICVLENGKTTPIEGGLEPAYNEKLRKIMYWGGLDKRGLLIIDFFAKKTVRVPKTKDYSIIGFDWSHDGKKICFASRMGDKTYNLYTMNIDGTDLKKLTHYEQAIGWEIAAPIWSPDDTRIAFDGPNLMRTIKPNWAKTTLHPGTIYIIDSDGSGLVNIIGKKEMGGGNAAWSPNGKTIVFEGSMIGSRRNDLFVYDLETKDIQRVTHDEFEDREPTFSPDGKQIAFVSYPRDIKKGSELFVINVDGTGRARLTPPKRRQFGLTWVEDRYPRWYQ